MLALLLLACGPESNLPEGEPWLPDNEEPFVADEPVDDLVNARRFSLLLPTEAEAEVRCVLDEDHDEVHVVSAPASRVQAIEVYGLLADADYTCTVSSGDWSTVRRVHTEPPPAFIPLWEIEESGEWWGSYVLLNHGYNAGGRRTCLMIIDRDGRLRWYLRILEDPPDLDSQYLGGGQVLYGGGHEIAPTVVDLGHVLQRLAVPAFTGETYHHHAEQLPSGQVLSLVHDENTLDHQDWEGFGVTLLSPTMTSNEWTFRSQTYVDAGILEPPPEDRSDPWHLNAAIDGGDVMYLNFRQAHRFLAIDKSTQELLWVFGPDGDFTLLDDDGNEADPADFAWGAHAPELEGNRLLMYDNGYMRPSPGGYSRVVEFELDVPARTATVAWDYTEQGWFEQIWGDVDRLPDGQILFVRAHCEGCGGRGGTRTQVVVVDPETDTVSWRLKMNGATSTGYRAQAIGGCDIFANQVYCGE